MRECNICKKETNNKVYCSEKCQHQGYKKEKKQKILLNCDNCNKEFFKTASKIRKKNYCCRSCVDIHKKKIMIGSGNPMHGKKVSQETLEKKSSLMKELWKDEEYRKNVLDAREQVMEGRDFWFGNKPEEIERRKRKLIENLYGISYEEYMTTIFVEKEKYYREVWKITNKQPLEMLENFDKRARIDESENAYHLDHIVPIIHGFENKISPTVIGNISNLRFIPAVDNIKKGRKSE